MESTEGIGMKYSRHVSVRHNKAMDVILQVFTNTLKVNDDLYASLLQHILATNAG